MANKYDMCVDYEILCDIQEKLRVIEDDLYCSTDQMAQSLRASHEFLSGYQFEKAQNTTQLCMDVVKKTGTNIHNAKDFIARLKGVLEEYGSLFYNGDV